MPHTPVKSGGPAADCAGSTAGAMGNSAAHQSIFKFIPRILLDSGLIPGEASFLRGRRRRGLLRSVTQYAPIRQGCGGQKSARLSALHGVNDQRDFIAGLEAAELPAA